MPARPKSSAGQAPAVGVAAADSYRFIGPYPVDVMAPGVGRVVTGDVVAWPDGPPDLVNWQPAADPPPTPPAAGDGAAPEES